MRADRVLERSDLATPGSRRGSHTCASRGVDVRLGEPVEAIAVRDGRISGATVGGRTVTADYYVAALPVEIMRTLLSPELRAAEPRLNGLDRLVTRWMNGIMFYLREDLPLVHGHAIYLDSEWALTSISQRQFWRDVDFSAGSAACCRWTSPSGSAPGAADGQGRGARARRRRSARRSGASCSDHLDDALDGVEVVPGSSTRRSSSRTRPARPTPSRCW